MPRDSKSDPDADGEEETFALDQGHDVPIYSEDGKITLRSIDVRKAQDKEIRKLRRMVKKNNELREARKKS